MVTKTGEIEVQLECVHVNWASWAELCLGQVEPPAWVRLNVRLSVTVPEELISIYLEWLFVLWSSVGDWLRSRYDLSVAVKLVEPHGLHFEANVLVCDFWV